MPRLASLEFFDRVFKPLVSDSKLAPDCSDANFRPCSTSVATPVLIEDF